MALLIFIFCLISICGLIAAHEFGHLIVALRNGVEVEEYSIFFGPTIYKRKTKVGWVFKIGTIPLGGYVKLKGEHDSDQVKGGYGIASTWVKTKILLAGVAVNFVMGIILLTISAFIGIPHSFNNQYSYKKDEKVVHTSYVNVAISGVMKNSPAQKAGLKSGDSFVSLGIDNNHLTKITEVKQLQDLTKSLEGKNVIIRIVRSSKLRQFNVALNTKEVVDSSINNSNPQGYLGVELSDESGLNTYYKYTYSAPIVALQMTKQATVLTYQGIWNIVKGGFGIVSGYATHNKKATANAQSSASQLHGIVLIVYVLNKLSHDGIRYCVYLIAIISLTLALINVLPIIPMDGGRLFVMLFFRLIKKPLTKELEEKINTFGFLFIIALVFITVYLDAKWIGWL